jgi:hypothetical protein
LLADTIAKAKAYDLVASNDPCFDRLRNLDKEVFLNQPAKAVGSSNPEALEEMQSTISSWPPVGAGLRTEPITREVVLRTQSHLSEFIFNSKASARITPLDVRIGTNDATGPALQAALERSVNFVLFLFVFPDFGRASANTGFVLAPATNGLIFSRQVRFGIGIESN